MRTFGYEVEPAPCDDFPLTARVYGPDNYWFTFLNPEDAEDWLNASGMVGGAARAYMAWHEQRVAQTAGGEMLTYTPASNGGTAVVRFNLSVVAEALDDPVRAVEARVVLNFWEWVQKHKREEGE